jgi:hypothetical protein
MLLFSETITQTGGFKVAMLLSVDPGLRGCGFAWWEGSDLRYAGYAEGIRDAKIKGPPAWLAVAQSVLVDPPGHLDRLAVETMRVYTGGKADPADLLELQGVAGCLVGLGAPRSVEGVPASAWKGQVPRDVLGARLERWTRAQGWWDRVRIPSRKTNLNDVMHAIGIGRYVLCL